MFFHIRWRILLSLSFLVYHGFWSFPTLRLSEKSEMYVNSDPRKILLEIFTGFLDVQNKRYAIFCYWWETVRELLLGYKYATNTFSAHLKLRVVTAAGRPWRQEFVFLSLSSSTVQPGIYFFSFSPSFLDFVILFFIKESVYGKSWREGCQ